MVREYSILIIESNGVFKIDVVRIEWVLNLELFNEFLLNCLDKNWKKEMLGILEN